MAKNKGGRPSKYSRELALSICEKTAQGNSLVKICQEDGMPGYSTVLAWKVSKDPTFHDFQEMYARAKEDQADFLAEEILDIADDSSQDTTTDQQGNARCDTEWVQRSKLRVDTRKWIAAKLKPRKYGDKLQHEAGDGGFKVILEDYRAGTKDPTSTETE